MINEENYNKIIPLPAAGGRTRISAACIRTYMRIMPNIIPNQQKKRASQGFTPARLIS